MTNSNTVSTSLTTTNAFAHPTLKSADTKRNDRHLYGNERSNKDKDKAKKVKKNKLVKFNM